MALLNILHYPDKRLHKVAKPVDKVDDRIRKLVADMAETMYAAPGIGLAATQVDVHERVIVIDVSEEKNELRAIINPEIVWSSDAKQVYEEGCMSVPDLTGDVKRARRVVVRGQLPVSGAWVDVATDAFEAVALQHEVDHTDGLLFLDRVAAAHALHARQTYL